MELVLGPGQGRGRGHFLRGPGLLDSLSQQVIQFNELFNTLQAQLGFCLGRSGPGRLGAWPGPGWGWADT